MKLTFTLMALLIAYHSINFYYGSRPRLQWETQRLNFQMSQRQPLSILSLRSSLEHKGAIDKVSYAFHQWAREVNPWDTEESYFDFLLAPETAEQRVRPELKGEIVQFADTVKQCGATLVILPVPLRDTLLTAPGVQTRSKVTYRKVISLAPDITVDLLSRFRESHMEARNSPLYVSDGHWSARGAAIGAEEVVTHLRERGWTTPADGRLLQAGTSFSQQYSAQKENFGQLLAHALQLKLEPYFFDGAGMYRSLEKISKSTKLRPGDLIVWEFPMTEFQQKRPEEPNSLSAISFSCEILQTASAKLPTLAP